MDEPLELRPMAATLLTQATRRACACIAVLVVTAVVFDVDFGSDWPVVVVTAVLFPIFATIDRSGRPELPADGLGPPPPGASNLGVGPRRQLAAMAWDAVALFAIVVGAERLLGGGGVVVVGVVLGIAVVQAIDGLRVPRWQRRQGGTVLERVDARAGEPRTFAA